MTLGESLTAAYLATKAVAPILFALAVVVPAVGTAAAWIGRGGRTDRDGRMIASAVVGSGLLLVVFEAVAIAVAGLVLERSILDADLLLLLAPPIYLLGCVAGIRLVFPLSQLASVRSAADIGAFLAACGVVLWLLTKFRGWFILFHGGFLALLLIVGFAIVLLRRLYRRAFKPQP